MKKETDKTEENEQNLPIPAGSNISSEHVKPEIGITEAESTEVQTIKGGVAIVKRESVHEKFVAANVEMLATGNLPYYGEFNLFINFHEANIGTCGVNVSSRGMNFYWDRAWVDSLLQTEANFILIHEDMHLLFDHIKRTIGYDQKLSNIAQDMIINQIILDDIMKSNALKTFITVPVDREEFIKFPDGKFLLMDGKKVKNTHRGKQTALFIPAEYKGTETFEEIYEWLLKKHDEYKKRKGQQKGNGQPQPEMSEGDGESQDGEGGQEGNGSGKGQKQSQKGSGKGDKNQDKDGKEKGDKGGCGKNGDEPSYGKYGKNDAEMSHLDKIFENIEQSKGQTLDQHLGDEVPDELRKEIVKDIMENLKARGLENGDMETILNKLRKSKKDYLKDIKRAIATDIFGSSKNRTIVRPHRHGIDGLKGSKKYKNKINCILDTSGSMGGDFEKVLSYVFQNDVEINMIQIDTQVQGFQVIKNKRELERMNIKGLGGTVLQPAIDFISETRNKISLYNTIILTDGYTDTLNFSHIKGKTLILSTAQQCGIDYDNGRVKQIIIDKDK